MADQVNLSGATRTNLLALQRTTDLISRTQERLSTGLKVNSAIDDAIAFFQSRSLSDRAGESLGTHTSRAIEPRKEMGAKSFSKLNGTFFMRLLMAALVVLVPASRV